MATAHPAKFPAATEAACGRRAEVPARLAEVFEREERCVSLPNDLARLQEHIREKISMSRRKAP
jgi:threonine synthase